MVGIAFGVMEGLRLAPESSKPSPHDIMKEDVSPGVPPSGVPGGAAPADGTNYVTRDELARALHEVQSSIDQKFVAQNVAVSALREMIAETGVLLNSVLERLEKKADQEAGEVKHWEPPLASAAGGHRRD